MRTSTLSMACPLMPVDTKRKGGRSPRLLVPVPPVITVGPTFQRSSLVMLTLSLETRFFPRSLWQTIRPDFRPDAPVDGFKPAMTVAGMKRGFEDDEDDAAQPSKKGAAGGDDEEGDEDGEDGELLEGDEDAQEEISDNEFDSDDDDGGDYNAEKYFEDGGDDMDDDGLGDGGGGGEEDF